MKAYSSRNIGLEKHFSVMDILLCMLFIATIVIGTIPGNVTTNDAVFKSTLNYYRAQDKPQLYNHIYDFTNGPSRMLIILDRSKTITETDFNDTKTFFEDFIGNNMIYGDSDTDVALITFCRDAANVEINFGALTTGCELFSQKSTWASLLPVDDVPDGYDGDDGLLEALEQASLLLKNTSTNDRKMVWLATNAGRYATYLEHKRAMMLIEDGVEIFGVGIGDWILQYPMEGYISQPNIYYYKTLDDWQRAIEGGFDSPNIFNGSLDARLQFVEVPCTDYLSGCDTKSGFRCFCNKTSFKEPFCACPSLKTLDKPGRKCIECSRGFIKIIPGNQTCTDCSQLNEDSQDQDYTARCLADSGSSIYILTVAFAMTNGMVIFIMLCVVLWHFIFKCRSKSKKHSKRILFPPPPASVFTTISRSQECRENDHLYSANPVEMDGCSPKNQEANCRGIPGRRSSDAESTTSSVFESSGVIMAISQRFIASSIRQAGIGNKESQIVPDPPPHRALSVPHSVHALAGKRTDKPKTLPITKKPNGISLEKANSIESHDTNLKPQSRVDYGLRVVPANSSEHLICSNNSKYKDDEEDGAPIYLTILDDDCDTEIYDNCIVARNISTDKRVKCGDSEYLKIDSETCKVSCTEVTNPVVMNTVCTDSRHTDGDDDVISIASSNHSYAEIDYALLDRDKGYYAQYENVIDKTL